MSSVAERFGALRDTGVDLNRAREGYRAYIKLRRAEGWTEADVDEANALIAIDFAEGPGVEREQPIADRNERIRLWAVYFDAETAVKSRPVCLPGKGAA